MDIQIQEKDGDLFCLKHKEKITMFIVDQQVPFKDTLLCPECFEERNTICTKIISLTKAKQMIQEQKTNINQSFDSKTISLLDNLKSFSIKLMDYKNKIIQTIEVTLGIIGQWISDIDVQRNQLISKSVLMQFQELHENKLDQTNTKNQLQKIQSSHQDKLQVTFKKLYSQEELIKCHHYLTELLILEQNNFQQGVLIENIPKKCQQINAISQIEECRAIAWNKSGSLMVATCEQNIKVWQFNKGKLIDFKKLIGHSSFINCLIFSKNINWFVSASEDSTIKGWKEQGSNWISTSPQKHHDSDIYCLLLNHNENELISCGSDKTIKIWKVDCPSNQILFSYTLDKKHANEILSISINFNETYLVSCGSDGRIILWTKNQNQKWEYTHHLKVSDGNRICFVSDTQFLFQSEKLSVTQVFSIENSWLIEQANQKINLKDAAEDTFLFPSIYNKKRQVIIQKHNKYVYIIQQQNDQQIVNIWEISAIYPRMGITQPFGIVKQMNQGCIKYNIEEFIFYIKINQSVCIIYFVNKNNTLIHIPKSVFKFNIQMLITLNIAL